MCAKFIWFGCVVVAFVANCQASPLTVSYADGKYVNSAQNGAIGRYQAREEGHYRASAHNDGHYVHMVQPYRHTDDHRELGIYRHIPYPYDGGYGPYSGSNIPYMHIDKPYDHNLYTSTTTKKPTTTTKRTTTTTTTTTTTPRPILFNYDDEGRHKILHQEELRKKDKYDHAFLTENGIYGEEQANLHHQGGTHAKGYYEYTGDDGKLYRVNYKSTHEGFMPMGDHIPTPPPIPEAIARALKYVEDQRKANGNRPQFDHRGFRIDQMPKDLMAKIKSIHAEDMPKEIGDQIRMLQHEMEMAEREELQMKNKVKQQPHASKRTSH